MLRRVFATLLMALSITAVATAQSATAPSSQPAISADSNTPKGTLLLLSRAALSGDSDSVKDLFHATDPGQRKLADVLIQRTEVYAKFRAALVKAFGDDIANQLAGDSAADAAMAEKRLAEAPVTIDNDKASVQMEGKPVDLVRVDGKWKLPMAPLTEGMTPADIDTTLQQIKMLSDVVTQMTDEVGQGKYKTGEEVSDAIRGKLASAMLQQDAGAATTKPATAPSGL